MELGQDLVDGLLQLFGVDLASLAFVRTDLVVHDGDAVLLVAGVPGLDGAPGELSGVAVLVGEGQEADGFDAGLDGVADGHVNGAQDTHLEVRSGIAHEVIFVFFVFG